MRNYVVHFDYHVIHFEKCRIQMDYNEVYMN